MKHTMRGKICLIGETEVVGAKGFQKRLCVICDNPEAERPHEIPFEATGAAITALNEFKKGDDVDVSFYVNGRGWDSPKDGKRHYFCSLSIADISKVGEGEAPTIAEAPSQAQAQAENDDLPF